MTTRSIACIDLSDFDKRVPEIAAELAHAATDVGFLQVTNHGIPQAAIDAQFARSQSFFALSDEAKAQSPFVSGTNRGWEKGKQVRPSSGVPDMKESLQVQFNGMEGIWPREQTLPGFRDETLTFMTACQNLSKQLLRALAIAFKLPEDFFTKAHNAEEDDCAATLRMLHYHDITGSTFPENYWRAAPHADFDTITLLFQRPGQGGLEACPGAEARTAYGLGDDWTPVEPLDGAITINFGRMLTRWTDDRVRATLHRVRAPKPGEYQGPRYSIAFFNQANVNAVITSPGGLYPPITGGDFVAQAMKANFDTKYKEGANESPFLAEEAFHKKAQVPVEAAA